MGGWTLWVVLGLCVVVGQGFFVFFFLVGVFLSFFSFGSLFHGCHGMGIYRGFEGC
jgi:hypothetical protein